MTESPRVVRVTAEYRTDSDVVATPTPRLSWRTETSAPDWVQGSAELSLDGYASASVVITDDSSVLVDWPFAPMAAGDRASVRVRVTGVDGVTSGWSDPCSIVAGFLAEGAWSAGMIGLRDQQATGQPALLRTEFDLASPVRRATLYATAHGVYQVRVNGTEVDDEQLKPGWTAYQYRLTHETTDVTALLSDGPNVLGVSLAGGWFTESFGFRDLAAPFYGTEPAAAVQLVVEHTDGTVTTILSDESWSATGSGAIVASGIYAGEDYDARREIAGWAETGFDSSGWSPVRVDGEFPLPTPRSAPPVRRIEELPVTEVTRSPSGKLLVDFGQNLVGRLRITVDGSSGETVTLRHAEVLENGELGIRPLRNARATDTYTLAGGGPETWEAQFTFHGFRYAEITGWPGEFDPANVTAVVMHSDLERTGWFESSNPLVNQLHSNVVWGMRGNFVSLPTDCPQRDERLGWTGDIQVFTPTASFLYESNGFLASWLEDLALEQKAADGVVPFIVPNVLSGFSAPAAAWGDAATVVPWVLAERFGDTGVLEAQYDSMRSWVDTLAGISGERLLWEDKFQFGDWLDPDAPADYPADAKTDPDIVASAYFYRSTYIVAETAQTLGRTEDARKYGELAARIKEAFLREFVTSSGRMLSDAQTSYGLAIVFGLFRDDAERQSMGDRLATLVRAAGYRIGTGFVGTPLVADALTETGHLDVAGRLLTQTENPSWLYPVTMGATTIWERWDSMLEDGSINPGEMTSFNHYALGAIADWMHRSLAGLAPGAAGYRELLIEPRPLAGFEHASASHVTPYGLAQAGWSRADGSIVVHAIVPPNTSASVRLPDGTALTVGSGSHEWTVRDSAQRPTEGAVSIDTSLAAIVDDSAAYDIVWRAIAERDEHAARAFRRRTSWTPGRSLGELVFEFPPATQAAIAEGLAGLSRERGR